MKRVIIDTDAGVDDALALIFALRSPELFVEAITTVSGNVHVDLCTQNVLRVLDILRLPSPPPVARGEEKPLSRTLFTAPEVHGEDGLGGVHSIRNNLGDLKYPEPPLEATEISAPELIADKVAKYDGEISIVTLGPLTNIARAINHKPATMRSLKEIICMAGAFRTYGNTTPVAEFNAYVDPEALEIVLDSGIPVTFVPLDVTERVCLTEDCVAREISPLGTKLSEFVVDLVQGYMKYHKETTGVPGCFLHDPLAVGVSIDESVVELVEGYVQVETAGKITRGMTVCDLRSVPCVKRAPNARICTEVDSERFLRLFLSRIRG